jgi:hypothetical protein
MKVEIYDQVYNVAGDLELEQKLGAMLRTA